MLYDVVKLESDDLGYVRIAGSKYDFNGKIVAVLSSYPNLPEGRGARITALVERPPSVSQP